MQKIEDSEVIGKSCKEFHSVAKITDSIHNRVPGSVFEIIDDEHRLSDQYEVDAYKRVKTILKSGKVAWVYVEAGRCPYHCWDP